MKRRTLLTAMAAAFASSLAGCAVGPDFLRPEVEVPVDWRIALPQAEGYANLRWWEAFGDPALNRLVETALNENLDLQVAAARVERYLGQLSTTRSQFFPQVGYGLEASRNRSTEVGVTPMPAGTDPWYKLYQGSISANWQLDLFGRVRRQSEAAQARVFSSEQGRRGTIISVVASVAGGTPKISSRLAPSGIWIPPPCGGGSIPTGAAVAAISGELLAPNVSKFTPSWAIMSSAC